MKILLNPFLITLKLLQKFRIYQIRLHRYILINQYNYLTNKRAKIESDYLFDSNFKIDLDESQSEIFIAKNVVFREAGRITCFNNGKIRINEGVYFNRNCSLNCLFHIEIGEHCLFGENVKIYDHNHKFSEKGKLIKEQGYTTGAVILGRNCWVGSNTIILKGVTIGDNVVIGANNLIINDIPSNSIVKSTVASVIEKMTEIRETNKKPNFRRVLEPVKRKINPGANSLNS